MQQFKVTRVYTNAHGESCFDEVSYPMLDNGPIGSLSAAVKVHDVVFRVVKPTYDDFHCAPHRQFVVLLDGGVEIETSTGQRRSFMPGEVLLMEDTTGKGHRSRNLIKQERRSLFIRF